MGTPTRIKTGRRPYLKNLVAGIIKSGESVGMPIEALKAQALFAIQDDVKIGGKYGHTLAEIIDICGEALALAGYPTDRSDIVRMLANPKLSQEAARLLRETTERSRTSKTTK